MDTEPRINDEFVMAAYNYMYLSPSSAWDALRLRQFIFERYYALPAKVEKVKNQPMTSNRDRYKKQNPIYSTAPAYFNNPTFHGHIDVNAYMDANSPIPAGPSVKIMCSRCWRVVVKHLERVRNNVVVNFRKKINY